MTTTRDDTTDSSIGSLLRARSLVTPDRPFCAAGDRRYTFAEMDRRSDEVSVGFAGLGVTKGDRVAVLSPNRAEFLEVHFGLAKLGAVQIPLNAFLKGTFLRHQLSQSRASVLVTDGPGFAAALPLLAELSDLRQVILFDGAGASAFESLPIPVLDYRDVPVTGASAPDVAVGPDDTMAIVYTSGTTGLPKGCVLSHGYYQRSARLHVGALELTSADALYTTMPLFHAGASMTILTSALVLGIPVCFDAQFSASTFLSRLAETGATAAFAVGAMGLALLATAPSAADRAHRVHTMMIAPLAPADQDRFRDRFGIEAWTSVFGQTECMPIAVSPRSARRDRSGCGAPAPDLDVALLGADGRQVPPGEPGEICIRPRARYAMFDGYWAQPSAMVAAGGQMWFHTGDTGVLLDSGELRFVDRRKDTLRRRGENISSLELDAAIRAHPKIADVAVHAVPSPLGEDDIKACIVLTEGETVTPVELFDYFRHNLAYYAVPRYVEILPRLPVNAVNRVLKYELRARPVTDEVWDFDALGLTVGRHERRDGAPVPIDAGQR